MEIGIGRALGAPYFLRAMPDVGAGMDMRYPRNGRFVPGDGWAKNKPAVLVAALAVLAVPAVSAVLAQGTSSVARSDVYRQMQLTFSPWAKICNKDARPGSKRVCVTVADGRSEDGEPAVSVALIEIDGEQHKLLRLRMPYDVALEHGTRLIIDQWQPATAPYVRCLPAAVRPGGCLSDYEATAELISRMKRGTLITFQAFNVTGQIVSAQTGLTDFAQAF